MGMTHEEKQLLLIDISGRLRYKTYVKTTNGIGYIYAINTSQLIELSVANDSEYWSKVFNISEIKPYLRPMSSMTEEEKAEFNQIFEIGLKALEGPEGHTIESAAPATFEIDFYNRHHLDYRGLISMGLALEAPEGMYKTK